MFTSDDSNWPFSRTFTFQFQASRYALESRIAAASNSSSKSSPSPEHIQELSISLAKLTKTLAGATGSLPSYDQKQYELQLKELERSIEALRVSNVPKIHPSNQVQRKLLYRRKTHHHHHHHHHHPRHQRIYPSPLIHDLERCVVVLGCHQFTMHASSEVDV
ncbi:hypothetical protein K443DRAFT_381023 [Laccaria amethystina LaAM-08-1]|uniref:Tubulin-specific chaperone C N-terminal domain-containing protein n=1 Tax=Laccaria amethystina LaAM-08-1 TaxID=1095629 RepID=A0A0C9WIX9_9AGAR|nr:hypothetical protein K443DRAFT_381023 [Laccaria amethystina LaAM-08-1]